MKTSTKKIRRIQRHHRVRMRISGTGERPRVAIFKSNRTTYIQVINDLEHKTLIGLKPEPAKKGTKATEAAEFSGNKEKAAFLLGKTVAEKMKSLGISEAVLDRAGFMYHGRVKAVAEGLRAGGIKV